MDDRLARAREVAERAHAGQFRKGTRVPYVTHTVAVAEIVSRYTDDEDVVIAALFHDILEDVPSRVYSERRMLDEFGPRVVGLVKAVSEDKRADDETERPWRERKLSYMEHVRSEDDPCAMLICAADKIHNSSTMLSDYGTIGDGLWDRFNASKEDELWYYESMLAILSGKDLPEGLIGRLAHNVSGLEKIVKGEK